MKLKIPFTKALTGAKVNRMQNFVLSEHSIARIETLERCFREHNREVLKWVRPIWPVKWPSPSFALGSLKCFMSLKLGSTHSVWALWDTSTHIYLKARAHFYVGLYLSTYAITKNNVLWIFWIGIYKDFSVYDEKYLVDLSIIFYNSL